MRTALLAALALLAYSGVVGANVDSGKLHQVDHTFICPEDLPSSAARDDAIRQFTRDVATAWPDITIEQMITFRVAVLERHHCIKALEAIRRHTQEKDS
jgi:hypothetical protein